VYGELKKYERAIQDCDQAIELDPDYVNAHNNRGFAYQALGKTVEADFKKYEELTGQKP
jgi:tetratricopeptide (TPR) repeat protein